MGINVFNEDCLPYMRKCKNNEFDLAIVDPPYGINQGGDKNYTRSKIAVSKNYHSFSDKEPPKLEYFEQLKRISKNQIIRGGNYFMDHLGASSCWIVWDKVNGNTDFADCELAYTDFKTAVRKFVYKWHGMLQENMKKKEVRIHPTQKPVQLYKWLLTNYAKPGQTIFDSHFGSGSIAIACHDLGFDLTAFEIDKEYYQAAMKRLRTHQAQLQLFKD